MISAAEALEKLREGNRRFASGSGGVDVSASQLKRRAAVEKQQPFAVILGCSDSRVPVEMIFDQDLGDLFVIRVAGNVVAPSQIGSVEFAAEKFGTRLVVVLGHSRCGAVEATLEELRRPSGDQSPNLRSIVDRVRPAVENLLENGPDEDESSLLQNGVRANVRHAVQALKNGSAIIESLLAGGDLDIVGAQYSLETGLVEILDPD
jgi:carbonic anhydrase